MAFQKILVFVNDKKEDAEATVEKLKEWTEKQGIKQEIIFYDDVKGAEIKGPHQTTLAVTIGGDGTFLKAASKVAPYRIPLLGINLGSLGFLTLTRSTDINRALDRLWEGEYEIEERMRIECQIKETPCSCLNDVVITRTDLDRFTELELFVDDNLIGYYPGDGIIISTPTGSTAYSLSCGGPIVLSKTKCIVIAPLASHTLGLRPIILPPEATVKIKAHCESSILADGDKLAKLESGEEIKITKSPINTKMAMIKPRPNFFTILNHKLEWDAGLCRKKRRGS